MEERKNILDYGAQVMCIFGFTMLCMMVFACLFGEAAKGISAFFALGSEGITVQVMAEFLLLAVLIVFLRYFFFTDRFLKKMPVLARTVLMVLSILVVMSGFIFLFDWFPVNMWQPWVMFLLSFFICFGGSVGISVWKARLDNKKLQEGLRRLQEQEVKRK